MDWLDRSLLALFILTIFALYLRVPFGAGLFTMIALSCFIALLEFVRPFDDLNEPNLSDGLFSRIGSILELLFELASLFLD